MSTKDRIVELLLERQPAGGPLLDQLRRALSQRVKTGTPTELDTLVAGLLPLRSSGRMTLQEVSDALVLKPPTVLQHLRQLERQGRVVRTVTPGTNSPTYEVAPFFEANWCDPQQRVLLRWRSTTGIDWRYPLVSRVPHAPAQRVLLRLLPELDAAIGRAADTITTPDSPQPYEFGVYLYGSAARGDARAGSDLDLLLVPMAGSAAGLKKRVTKVAQAANLWAEMPIDLRIAEVKDVMAFPEPFLKALGREAITVFWRGRDPMFIEADPVRHFLASGGRWHGGDTA